jgi:hypothetical protein
MKIGDIIEVAFIGDITEVSFGFVRIVRVHLLGTYDVECLKTGKQFRITGCRT